MRSASRATARLSLSLPAPVAEVHSESHGADPIDSPVMEQRRLGRSGLRVSRLALGTMTWGRDTDEHEAADQMSAFLDAGGTLVDTAAGYGDGESERVVGRLLATKVDREELVIATKAGVLRRSGERVVDTSRKALLDALDGSLQRMAVDTVDLWQVHAWSDDTSLEETLAAVDLAVRRRATPGCPTTRLADRTRSPGSSRPRRAGRRSCRPRWSTPAAARHRARGAACRDRARAGCPALVAARRRRADWQVPRRHACRLAGRLAALRPLHRAPAQRPVAADVDAVATGPTASRCRRWRVALAWVRDAPGSPRRSSARGPPPSCASRCRPTG